MAGVSVDAGGGGRRSLDSEINMIPMIDLLMVTISFLLITAVWTHMSRIEASAQVPSSEPTPPCEGAACPPERRLHIEMRDPAKFVLYWTEDGKGELGRTEVPRESHVDRVGAAKIVRFPALADAVGRSWRELGVHRADSDRVLDKAVLHTGDDTPYVEIVGAMDAVNDVARPVRAGGAVREQPALAITFAAK